MPWNRSKNALCFSCPQNAKRIPLVATVFDEFAGVLPPDGRWLAYQSNETGWSEVYVRDMSAADGRKRSRTGRAMAESCSTETTLR